MLVKVNVCGFGYPFDDLFPTKLDGTCTDEMLLKNFLHKKKDEEKFSKFWVSCGCAKNGHVHPIWVIERSSRVVSFTYE